MGHLGGDENKVLMNETGAFINEILESCSPLPLHETKGQVYNLEEFVTIPAP